MMKLWLNLMVNINSAMTTETFKNYRPCNSSSISISLFAINWEMFEKSDVSDGNVKM